MGIFLTKMALKELKKEEEIMNNKTMETSRMVLGIENEAMDKEAKETTKTLDKKTKVEWKMLEIEDYIGYRILDELKFDLKYGYRDHQCEE